MCIFSFGRRITLSVNTKYPVLWPNEADAANKEHDAPRKESSNNNETNQNTQKPKGSIGIRPNEQIEDDPKENQPNTLDLNNRTAKFLLHLQHRIPLNANA
mmetsp:Transcript_10859/g.30514  ORF Transcript_10859/g.30514 Transcript_10859/m.30514 type:complete len:101 (-) Transcript_10859:2842-3144(-)